MTAHTKCPACHKEIELEVEVESPSDYIPQDTCPECEANIYNDPQVQHDVYEAVADHYAGLADYYRD